MLHFCIGLFLSEMIASALIVMTAESLSNGRDSYIIGGIIALLILGYLVYTLLRPDKF